MPMDQEAQVPTGMTSPDVRMVGADMGLSSPLISSNPMGASKSGKMGGSVNYSKLGDTSWWSETPSRQSTGGSTTASTPDWASPDISHLPRRLERLQEQRGWKHFFKHTMAVPIAVVVGMAIGIIFTSLLMQGLAAQQVPAAAEVPAPATVPVPYATALPPTEVPVAYLMSPALNNSCIIPQLAMPSGKPQTFDACGFVIKSTDETWNLRGDVDAAIDKYFHENYVDAGSWGRRIIGKKALREAIFSEMRAFPDIRIHITDCLCKGNDIDGYKCAMPDILTGTNLGPSAYGPATGKYARWTGLVESFVKRDPKTGLWQYYAEWGVHDEWALIQQLGLEFARVPRPPANTEPLHDCRPLLGFLPEPHMDANDVAIQEAHVRAKSLRYP